ncbi:hypothetical protein KY321_00830 [Candidatus Woesearchaeota archaeon]|nr:hypothetical protein [Candidatus Woesearchaeota archaeon]
MVEIFKKPTNEEKLLSRYESYLCGGYFETLRKDEEFSGIQVPLEILINSVVYECESDVAVNVLKEFRDRFDKKTLQSLYLEIAKESDYHFLDLLGENGFDVKFTKEEQDQISREILIKHSDFFSACYFFDYVDANPEIVQEAIDSGNKVKHIAAFLYKYNRDREKPVLPDEKRAQEIYKNSIPENPNLIFSLKNARSIFGYDFDDETIDLGYDALFKKFVKNNEFSIRFLGLQNYSEDIKEFYEFCDREMSDEHFNTSLDYIIKRTPFNSWFLNEIEEFVKVSKKKVPKEKVELLIKDRFKKGDFDFLSKLSFITDSNFKLEGDMLRDRVRESLSSGFYEPQEYDNLKQIGFIDEMPVFSKGFIYKTYCKFMVTNDYDSLVKLNDYSKVDVPNFISNFMLWRNRNSYYGFTSLVNNLGLKPKREYFDNLIKISGQEYQKERHDGLIELRDKICS